MTADGEEFEGCPRTTLRRVIEDSRDVLRGVQSGARARVLSLRTRRQRAIRAPPSSDCGSYFDHSATDRGEDARIAIVSALEAMGIGIASAHHEHGAGQHEIDFKDASILATADSLVTARIVAKQIAGKFGLLATFMPKPLETLAGSGVHVYFALPRSTDETPLAEGELHQETLFAIGGLLEHAPAFTAVCNPLVNSYKRLVAAWDAPIYTAWSYRSANSLVRIPSEGESGRPRLEVRSADPACNPYLALAVLVASIGARDPRSTRCPAIRFRDRPTI